MIFKVVGKDIGLCVERWIEYGVGGGGCVAGQVFYPMDDAKRSRVWFKCARYIGQMVHKIEHTSKPFVWVKIGLKKVVEIVKVVLPEFAMNRTVPVRFFRKNVLYVQERKTVFTGFPGGGFRNRILEVNWLHVFWAFLQRISESGEAPPFSPQIIKYPVADLHRAKVSDGMKKEAKNDDGKKSRDAALRDFHPAARPQRFDGC